MSDDEPEYPVFDGPQPRAKRDSYTLPPEKQRLMAALAAHLSARDAISPLKRRMATFRTEQERERWATEEPNSASRGAPELWQHAQKEADDRAPYPTQSPLSAGLLYGMLTLLGLTFYNEVAGVHSDRGIWSAAASAVLLTLIGAFDVHSKRKFHHRIYREALERLSWQVKHKRPL